MNFKKRGNRAPEQAPAKVVGMRRLDKIFETHINDGGPDGLTVYALKVHAYFYPDGSLKNFYIMVCNIEYSGGTLNLAPLLKTDRNFTDWIRNKITAICTEAFEREFRGDTED